jgi:hypothetical protein
LHYWEANLLSIETVFCNDGVAAANIIATYDAEASSTV